MPRRRCSGTRLAQRRLRTRQVQHASAHEKTRRCRGGPSQLRKVITALQLPFDDFLKKDEDFVKSLEAQEGFGLLYIQYTVYIYIYYIYIYKREGSLAFVFFQFEQRQKSLQSPVVLLTTGTGQLSNRQPVAQGYIVQEIEQIEREARSSPKVEQVVAAALKR